MTIDLLKQCWPMDVRARYSKKTANEQDARMLAKVSIQERIAEVQAELAEEMGISSQMVVKELAKLAQ